MLWPFPLDWLRPAKGLWLSDGRLEAVADLEAEEQQLGIE